MPTKLDSPDLRDLTSRNSHLHGADRSLRRLPTSGELNDVIVDSGLDDDKLPPYNSQRLNPHRSRTLALYHRTKGNVREFEYHSCCRPVACCPSFCHFPGWQTLASE